MFRTSRCLRGLGVFAIFMGSALIGLAQTQRTNLECIPPGNFVCDGTAAGFCTSPPPCSGDCYQCWGNVQMPPKMCFAKENANDCQPGTTATFKCGVKYDKQRDPNKPLDPTAYINAGCKNKAGANPPACECVYAFGVASGDCEFQSCP